MPENMLKIRRLPVTVLTMAICAMMLLCGCKNKNADVLDTVAPETADNNDAQAKEADGEKPVEEKKDPELKNGLYSMDYEEEFADGVETFTNYLYFGTDGKGFYITEEDVPMTFSDGTITDENGNKYSYTMTADDVLELDDGSAKTEYKYAGKEITEDVLDIMKHFPDGTLKVNNEEAGYAFEDLITSDVISFYGTGNNKEYVAEGETLEKMSAAYIELTDSKLSVLFVKTPDAPKEVGYEHILQYLDGKTYDIAGVNKIEAIYKEAGVIAASFDSGDESYTYYYKPDSNGELYVFASEDKKNDVYSMYNKSWEYIEVSKEDFDKELEKLINGSEKIVEIDWKTLDKAL